MSDSSLITIASIISLIIATFLLYFPYIWCKRKNEQYEAFGLRWFMTKDAWHNVIVLTMFTLIPLTPVVMNWPGGQIPYRLSYTLIFELLGSGIAAAFIEETFFRGWVQTILSRKIGAFYAIIFTSFLFACTHLIINPSWVRFATFFPGLVMGWLRWRHGSVMPSILYHSFGNVWSIWFFPR
ncbi:MAG: SYNERG-CTERM system CAAX-type protease [Synergistaceae bacterium]|nr:SYNERG-CTERM system CAAX-type protease [Synergistaceae bacterium]